MTNFLNQSAAIWPWLLFLGLIGIVLVIDLGVLNRHAKPVSPKRALIATGVFVLMALAFTAAVYWIYDAKWMQMGLTERGGLPMTGQRAAEEFLTGWMLEYSLSVDNLFVFTLIFGHFRVPLEYQHRVLFWGILGALVMRGLMIAAGAALIATFHWMIYLFGAFLVYTAFKMLSSKDEEAELESMFIVRVARKLFPISPVYDGSNFFTRLNTGARAATPLFLVLLTVEVTDVVFAVDSIPAIFGVTQEPFIVFTSNVFAIMGLRSLYFALAGMMDKFRFLKISLSGVLAFVGVKMLIHSWVPINGAVSLGVIALTLTAGIVASLLIPAPAAPPPADQKH